jgi:hypothetical protein
MIAIGNVRWKDTEFGRALEEGSSALVANGTSAGRETPYDLFLRPAILNQRRGTNQVTGRMTEHIEAAIC